MLSTQVNNAPALDASGMPLLEPVITQLDEPKPGAPVPDNVRASEAQMEAMRDMVAKELAMARAAIVEEVRGIVITNSNAPPSSIPATEIPDTITTTSPPSCVSPSTFAALHHLIPNAQFRSVEQATATEMICRRCCHVLAILPTGGGKSITYLTAVKKEAPSGMTTIYLAPLRALVDDQLRVGTKYGLQCAKWEGPGHGVISGSYALVLGTYDVCDNVAFLEYVKRMADQGLIGRIVIDEAHYPHQNVDFRKNLANLTQITRLGLPIVLLSATLAKDEVTLMCDFLQIPRKHVVEVRARTPRLNLRYSVVFHAYNGGQGDYSSRAQHAISCFNQQVAKLGLQLGPKCLGLIYTTSRLIAEAIRSHDPGSWIAYTGEMSPTDREKAIADFGSTYFTMTCTSAFSMGIDNPHIAFVMHYDTPWTLVDFAQESGRAGRSGQKAYSTVILTSDRPSKTGKEQRQEMVKAMYRQQCRRTILDQHMDGLALNCLSHGPGTVLCDVCEKEVANAVRVRKPEIPPIAPVIAREHAQDAIGSPPALPTMDVDEPVVDDWQPSRSAKAMYKAADIPVPPQRDPSPPPPPPPRQKPPRPSEQNTAGPSRPQPQVANPTLATAIRYPIVASRPRTRAYDGPRIFNDAVLKYVRAVSSGCPVCVVAGEGPGGGHSWRECPQWKLGGGFPLDEYPSFKPGIQVDPVNHQPRLCTWCFLPQTSLDYHASSGKRSQSDCWHSNVVVPTLLAMWHLPKPREALQNSVLTPKWSIETRSDWQALLGRSDQRQQDISFGLVRMFVVEIPKWLAKQGKWPHKMIVDDRYSEMY